MRGRLARNSTVKVCAIGRRPFFGSSGGGLYSRLLATSSSRLPSTDSSRADVPALIAEEWTSFSSKKPGNRSRSKSAVMSAMARFEGRFFPSR